MGSGSDHFILAGLRFHRDAGENARDFAFPKPKYMETSMPMPPKEPVLSTAAAAGISRLEPRRKKKKVQNPSLLFCTRTMVGSMSPRRKKASSEVKSRAYSHFFVLLRIFEVASFLDSKIPNVVCVLYWSSIPFRYPTPPP